MESKNKYNIGDIIFYTEAFARIPGTVKDVRPESGNWIYEVELRDHSIIKDVPENRIKIRKITAPPKYTRGDQIQFTAEDKCITGVVCVVDAYGTFEQDDEVSYDIMVKEENTVYKHIRESWVS